MLASRRKKNGDSRILRRVRSQRGQCADEASVIEQLESRCADNAETIKKLEEIVTASAAVIMKGRWRHNKHTVELKELDMDQVKAIYLYRDDSVDARVAQAQGDWIIKTNAAWDELMTSKQVRGLMMLIPQSSNQEEILLPEVSSVIRYWYHNKVPKDVPEAAQFLLGPLRRSIISFLNNIYFPGPQLLPPELVVGKQISPQKTVGALCGAGRY